MMSFYTEQESTYKNIAVIGCGAAGGMVSILLAKNPYYKVTAFDIKEPFSTLLPTGGGRCNITNAENDIKEFAKNYPRGEKFLLSVFSKFNAEQTRKLFKDLGIKTYVQPDRRVFPQSNSSADTINILRKHLNTSNFKFVKEKVVSLEKKENSFEIKTATQNFKFDKVVIATGGRGSGFELAKHLGHHIVECKPSLCALDIAEKDFYELSGLSFSDVEIEFKNEKSKRISCSGDFLFSHKSITGPAVFKVSAMSAYMNFSKENPLVLNIKLKNIQKEEIEKLLVENNKKSIKNTFSLIMPEKFVSVVLKIHNIDGNKQTAQIKKNEKEILINSINNLKLNAISRIKDSEIVTAGGIDLKEINAKTTESKIVQGLYCIGEVLDIDGFTGGFNLQNCWSGAYLCSLSI